jgi:hypothetical protein
LSVADNAFIDDSRLRACDVYLGYPANGAVPSTGHSIPDRITEGVDLEDHRPLVINL